MKKESNNMKDQTLSTVQPFEFTKEFTKQLKELDLLDSRSYERAGLCCDGSRRL